MSQSAPLGSDPLTAHADRTALGAILEGRSLFQIGYSPRTFTKLPVATYGVALNPNSSSARKPVTF